VLATLAASAGLGDRITAFVADRLCDEPSNSTTLPSALEGVYEDEWGSLYTFTETMVLADYGGNYLPIKFDVEVAVTGFTLAKAIDEDTEHYSAGWYPAKWNRFDWRWTPDGLRFCNSIYDADTVSETMLLENYGGKVTTSMLNLDESETGCGGFPFSYLKKVG